jgi:phage gpG-like protein
VSDFRVDVSGTTHLLGTLSGIIRRVTEPRPALNAVGDSIERKAATAFQREGPGWAPLKPATQRDRARRGYGPSHPILERTGGLRRSASEQGGAHRRRYRGTRSIEVGSADPKAVFHQFGTRNMTARPFYRITRVEITVWRIMASNHVMGRPIT